VNPSIYAKLARRLAPVAAIVVLVAAMGGTWRTAAAAPPTQALQASPGADPPVKKSHGELTGKVNLNTATVAQLELLPTVGPAKARRIVVWREKNGGFRRIADLRRVRGIGYKTFKRLAPFHAVQRETTLAAP
jgi:competence protein ComEA